MKQFHLAADQIKRLIEPPKHWIGINPSATPDNLLMELTKNSYEIVKAKYRKFKK